MEGILTMYVHSSPFLSPEVGILGRARVEIMRVKLTGGSQNDFPGHNNSVEYYSTDRLDIETGPVS
jgi:hypothetical protein